MAILNFNANEVEPNTPFEVIPAGKYNAVIVESEMKATRAGTGRYLKLVFEITDGDFAGRKLFASINLENPNQDAVRIGRAELSAVCHAVNVLNLQDTVQLHNLPLIISVRVKKNQDGEPTNEVRGYEPRSGVKIPATPPPVQPRATASATPPWAK